MVREAYERARQLWEAVGRPSHFEPNLGLFWHHFVRGEVELADQIARELVQAGSARNDMAVKFLGTLWLAEAYLDRGEFAESRDHSEQSLTFYDPALVSRRNLYNGRVGALTVISRALFSLGHPDQSRLKAHEAVREARQLSQSYTLAFALMGAIFVEREIQPVHVVLEHSDEVIALNFGWLNPIGGVFRSWCLSALGQEQEGATMLADALSAYRATGALRFVPFFLLLQADALQRARRRTAALERLAESLHLIEKTHERWCLSELHRLKGELLKAEGEREQAEACFKEAIAVSRRQSAKAWELRAAVNLGRLWCKQGKRIDAQNLLEPLYNWFTEGFNTPDLQRAKTLLDELK
jgi:tetratricopeptide (TPR) repeat protein